MKTEYLLYFFVGLMLIVMGYGIGYYSKQDEHVSYQYVNDMSFLAGQFKQLYISCTEQKYPEAKINSLKNNVHDILMKYEIGIDL